MKTATIERYEVTTHLSRFAKTITYAHKFDRYSFLSFIPLGDKTIYRLSLALTDRVSGFKAIDGLTFEVTYNRYHDRTKQSDAIIEILDRRFNRIGESILVWID
jgi:hypothetical protein